MARHVAVAGKKSFSRLIIRIAIVAVALSMTVMIISTSLIRGFKTEISEKIFAFWGHIHITDTNITRSFESVPIEGGTELIDKISGLENVEYFAEKTFLNIPIGDEMVAVRTKGGVRHVQAFAQIGGIINHKEEFEAIVLKGVSTDFDWEKLTTWVRSTNISTSRSCRKIYFPKRSKINFPVFLNGWDYRILTKW